MATSRDSGHSASVRDSSVCRRLPSLSRYDLLLAVIPLAFLATLGVHTVLNVSFTLAVTGGAVIGVVALADALYVNPPSGQSGGSVYTGRRKS